MKKTITFDKEVSEKILEVFDKKVVEGKIVENNGEAVLSPEGEEVCIDEFAGLAQGSELFIKSDLPSLIEFSKKSLQQGSYILLRKQTRRRNGLPPRVKTLGIPPKIL